MKYKVLFRCDAADIKGIGSGHLIRCIVIAKILETRFSFKKKDILFITKSKNKYELGKKILRKYKYQVLYINHKIKKEEEINVLSKFQSKLLVIDKYKFYDSGSYKQIVKNFKKIIFIDSYNQNLKKVIYLNPTFPRVVSSKSPILIIPCF